MKRESVNSLHRFSHYRREGDSTIGNWEDPNIRNHVLGDTSIRYNTMFEPTSFVDKPTPIYNTFIEKNLTRQDNLIYWQPNLETMQSYNDTLKDNSPLYNFLWTSNYKAMQDSYYSLGQVYLYQIILRLNNFWSILDYSGEYQSKVTIPTKYNITNLFRKVLTSQNFKTIRELKSEEDINDAVLKLVVNVDIDYNVLEVIANKIYISGDDVKRRVESPLFRKYLARELTKLMTGYNYTSEAKFSEKINDLLNQLSIYIRKPEEA